MLHMSTFLKPFCPLTLSNLKFFALVLNLGQLEKTMKYCLFHSTLISYTWKSDQCCNFVDA